ncbi:MAG: sigma 54-interacting transcriptional regulator [Syntrophothermus sp.]|uniref:sigma-54 interaction domain-containing protein n=1 Tax=Syntrophothermus sp. TaxID=2736299 RepID=UPI002579580F|nr:sigma 54-interacting transcriptional regulator [Syntrophothermus sp.]NSW82948.1 sigma 54-interacting transcriptional regulator [Syntrophothermus sp.]
MAWESSEVAVVCSREELIQVIINSYDAILVTDKSGNVLLANRSTGRLLGVDHKKLVGKNVRDLVKEGLYDRSTAWEATETRSVVTGLIRSKYGTTLMATSTPVLDKNGDVVMVITNSRDQHLFDKFMELLERERSNANRYKKAMEYLAEADSEGKEIVAESPQMQQVMTVASAAAKTDSTIMLFGESGTGKEVMARYIHRNSLRAKEPFIPVNCAAIPSELMESEFFGYVAGAFTGASTQGKPGLFEIAHKGTLFLDEVAELPLPVQSKLLRVLETGDVQRLGSTSIHRTNVRLIAATNRDLKTMMTQGLFRRDLYYRLNVVPIKLPPLRERPEDIPILANKFLDELNRKYSFKKTFTKQTLEAFTNYNWPGNVRELRNVVERLVVTSTSDYLNFEGDQSLPNSSRRSSDTSHLRQTSTVYRGTLKSVLQMVEKEYINQVISECEGRISEAAQLLGIHRTVLYRKLRD